MNNESHERDLEWADAIADFGTPVESSILTDEEWEDAKNQNRVVSVLCGETGMDYHGQLGLMAKNVLCRIVFPSAVMMATTIRNVQLDDIDWDFSSAVGEAAQATERLMAACREGDTSALKSAITAGADVNHQDWQHDNITPLKLSTANGHQDCVAALINAGADISYDNGSELWRLATLLGHDNIAGLLDENGVESTPQEALIQAAHEGNRDVVAKLVDGKVDVNKSCSLWSPYHLEGTALNLAILSGHRGVVDFLMQHGADTNLRDDRGVTPWIAAAATIRLSDLCSDLESKGATPEPQTALVLASHLGNSTAVESLIGLGADPNGRAMFWRQDLAPMEAAFESHELGRYADIDESDDGTAKESLRCAVIGALIEQGADCNTATERGRPLLLRSVDKLKEDVLDILLEHGASVDASDENGDTALLIAASVVEVDCAKKLLLGGANPNAVDSKGQVPFMRLFDGWGDGWGDASVEFAKWLTAFGARVDATSKGSKTIRQFVKRAIRKAKDDECDVDCLNDILSLLDDEDALRDYSGVFAKEPETSEECFDRANCAINWLEDASLASQELARAVALNPANLNRVTAGLSSDDWGMRYIAAIALARLGESASPAISQLVECLDDENEDVIEAVVTALVEIGSETIPALSKMVSSPNLDLAVCAARTLCRIDHGQVESVLGTFRKNLPNDEDSLAGETALDAAKIHDALGDIELLREGTDAAIREYEAAVRLYPDLQVFGATWMTLAELKKKTCDESLAVAIECYNEAKREVNSGDYAAAEECYVRAIAAAPDFPWGHNDLAWQFVTCPALEHRNGKSALSYAMRASELSGNRYHGILDTLAAAYAEAGDFAKAAEIAEQAVSVAPEYARGEYQFNLDRYRSGLAWCEYEDDSTVDEDQ